MRDIEELYITSALHLLMQKKKSLLHDHETGAYRSKNGLACAVGILIKDEYYSPRIEGKDFINNSVMQILEDSEVNMRDTNVKRLLRELQSLHDDFPLSEWERELQNLEGLLVTYLT